VHIQETAFIGVEGFVALEQSGTRWCLTGVPLNLSSPVTFSVQLALLVSFWFDLSLLWDLL